MNPRAWFFSVDSGKPPDDYKNVTINRALFLKAFKKNLPVLYVETFKYSGDAFWRAVKKCVESISGDYVEPKSEFDDFLQKIYAKKELYNPQTINECIEYINNRNTKPLSNFILVTLPLVIKNPFKLISIISLMKETNNSVFIEFQNEKGAIEKMFDMYITYLDLNKGKYDHEVWDLRLMVADILVYFVKNFADSIVLSSQHTSYLHQNLVNLIKIADDVTAVSFIRLVLQFYQATLSRTENDVIIKRINSLIGAVPVKSPGHAMVAQFIVKEVPKSFPRTDLIKSIIGQEIPSNWDLNLVYEIVSEEDSPCLRLVVENMTRILVHSSVWCRSVGVFLSKILKENVQRGSKVEEWFISFLRQLTVSNALKAENEDILMRRKLVKEVLHSSSFMEVPFVKAFFSSKFVETKLYKEMLHKISRFNHDERKFFPFTKQHILVMEKIRLNEKKASRKRGKLKGKKKPVAHNKKKQKKTKVKKTSK